MAALIPALITFGLYAIYVIILSYTNPEKFGRPPQSVPLREKFVRSKKAAPILVLPVIILGGIYLGTYTATESAAVAVVYGLFVTLFISRTLSLKDLKLACLEGCYLSSMTLFILVGGLLFSNVVSQLQIGPALVSLTKDIGLTRPMLVLVMTIVLLFLGMFMSAAPIFFLSLPLFLPLAVATKIDLLWLGLFYTYMIEIGLLTPPVGLNLYVIQGTSGLPFWDVVRAMIPFLGLLLLSVFIIYIFPELATWLPSTMLSR
jgi:C4-dicarboxylate transporter DctM subunit